MGIPANPTRPLNPGSPLRDELRAILSGDSPQDDETQGKVRTIPHSTSGPISLRDELRSILSGGGGVTDETGAAPTPGPPAVFDFASPAFSTDVDYSDPGSVRDYLATLKAGTLNEDGTRNLRGDLLHVRDGLAAVDAARQLGSLDPENAEHASILAHGERLGELRQMWLNYQTEFGQWQDEQATRERLDSASVLERAGHATKTFANGLLQMAGPGLTRAAASVLEDPYGSNPVVPTPIGDLFQRGLDASGAQDVLDRGASELRSGADDLAVQIRDRLLAIDPALAQTFESKFGEALGSAAGFAGTALLTRSPASAAVLGAGLNAGEQTAEAAVLGADRETRRDVGEIARIVGASEGVPIAGLFRRFGGGPETRGALSTMLRQALPEAREEAIQELAQTVLNDVQLAVQAGGSMQNIEAYVESAVLGGLAGGAMGGVVGAADYFTGDQRQSDASPNVSEPFDPSRDRAEAIAGDAASEADSSPLVMEGMGRADIGNNGLPADRASAREPERLGEGENPTSDGLRDLPGDGTRAGDELAEGAPPITDELVAEVLGEVGLRDTDANRALVARQLGMSPSDLGPSAEAVEQEREATAIRNEEVARDSVMARAEQREAMDDLLDAGGQVDAGSAGEVDARLIDVGRTTDNVQAAIDGWDAAQRQEALQLDASETVDAAIADFIQPISRRFMADVIGDPSQTTQRAYFRARRANAATGERSDAGSPSEVAARIREESGMPVTEQQVIDFINANPNGPGQYRAGVRAARREVENNLRQITGGPVTPARIDALRGRRQTSGATIPSETDAPVRPTGSLETPPDARRDDYSDLLPEGATETAVFEQATLYRPGEYETGRQLGEAALRDLDSIVREQLSLNFPEGSDSGSGAEGGSSRRGRAGVQTDGRADREDSEAQRLPPTEDQIGEGLGTGSLADTFPDARLLGRDITENMRREGGASLVGSFVDGPADIASLAQVLRDPRFETLRYFFVRDAPGGQEIVGHLGVSARIPGSTLAFPVSVYEEIDRRQNEAWEGFMGSEEAWTERVAHEEFEVVSGWLQERLVQYDADGFYLLHNHPSGAVTPSEGDWRSTEAIETAAGGAYRGHIIIDSGKWSEILAPGEHVEHEFTDEQLSEFGMTVDAGEDGTGSVVLDPLLQPSDPHPELGRPISATWMLSLFAKRLEVADDQAVLIGVGSDGRVRGLAEIAYATLERGAEDGLRSLQSTISAFARHTGSGIVHIGGLPPMFESSSKRPEMRRAIEHLIYAHVIGDAVGEEGSALHHMRGMLGRYDQHLDRARSFGLDVLRNTASFDEVAARYRADESQRAGTGLSQAEIERVREALNLRQLERPVARRWESLLNRVIDERLYEDAESIVGRFSTSSRFTGNEQRNDDASPLSDLEHVAVAVAEARLLQRKEEAERLAVEASGRGDAAAEQIHGDRAWGALKALDRLLEGADRAGTAAGRALAIRRLALRRSDGDALELAAALTAARRQKGSSLTSDERAEISRLVDEAKAAHAEVERLQRRLDARDRRRAARAIREALQRRGIEVRPETRPERASRNVDAGVDPSQRQAARDEERRTIREEREQIKARINRRIGRQLNAGIDPDLARDIGRLALSYAKEAKLSLAEIVEKVRSDYDWVSELDVVAALAAPKRRQREQTEAEYERAKLQRRRAVVAVRTAQRALAPVSVRQKALELLETPRALLSSADLSAALRQGGVLVSRRPRAGVRVFAKALQAMVSESNADAMDLRLRESPHFDLAEMAGLYTAPVGSETAVAPGASREEDFASQILNRVPGVGPVIRASERNYTTFLNLIRHEAFAQFVDAHPDASMDELRAWADFVNVASGRGDLGSFAGAARPLSAAIFSPRFMVSRFQVLTRALNWRSARGAARTEALKDLAAFVGVRATALMLAQMALAAYGGDDDDAYVGLDPSSADFGKLVIDGELRLDTWAGVQQPVRALFRTGKVAYDTNARDEQPGFGGGVKDIWADFVGYKLAPTLSIAIAASEGQNAVGETQSGGEIAARSLVPLSLQEAWDASNDGDGSKRYGFGLAVLGISSLGIGANVYRRPFDEPDVAEVLERAAGPTGSAYRPGAGAGKRVDEVTGGEPRYVERYRELFEERFVEKVRTVTNLRSTRLRSRLEDMAEEAREEARDALLEERASAQN
ncbi:MAG: hypothetical protein Rubg2KO_15550 [Rubricoccaceae bacterium]